MANTDLEDGESCEMKGSGAKPYVLKNTGGVYSCSCPAWRNQSVPIESRTCKHLRKLRGDEAEKERVGTALPAKPKSAAKKDAPPLLLAHSWDSAVDLADWWMSEKLDGVRAYWTGSRFLSRLGNEYHAPEWFVSGLPETPLDGELWLDRGAFQRTVSIARRQDKSEHWREMKFVGFDAPEADGVFEDRVGFLQDHFASTGHEYASALEHVRCTGEAHLREELARIEGLGGEGLMLRQPGSAYEVGRSTTLLKVKTFHDAEAVVIGHSAGKGKHEGKVGALLVRAKDGVEFSVGTGLSDAQRSSPPAVGALVTYRYQELTDAGVPRFPSFLRAAALEAPMAPPSDAQQPISAGSDGGGSPSAATSYFEFVDGKSAKFWEVQVDGPDVTVRYGRIGAKGQSKTKSLASADAAQKHAAEQAEKKVSKGYTAATRPEDPA